jgi:predicted component of type VI protein secretion system
MKAELVPENGDPAIRIDRDVTVVGRHECCDVVINHAGLSKRHCILVRTDGLLVIRDLATTNGTKVKGQRIRWAALLPEDRVSLGGYKVRIYLGSDEMPSPSEQRQGRIAAAPSPPAYNHELLSGGFQAPSIELPVVHAMESAGPADARGEEGSQGESADSADSALMRESFEIVDDDDDEEIIDLD